MRASARLRDFWARSAGGDTFRRRLPALAVGATVAGVVGGIAAWRYVALPCVDSPPRERRPRAGRAQPESSSESDASLAPPATPTPAAKAEAVEEAAPALPAVAASEPLSSAAADVSATPASAPAPVAVESLDSPAALAALTGAGRALVLVTRGHAPGAAASARAALAAAAAAGSLPAGVRLFVVDDASHGASADALLARVGVQHAVPFVVALESFAATGRKFLDASPAARAPPTPAAVADFAAAWAAGALPPALLGQPRPAGDAARAGSPLVEVVAESFPDLVARADATDVLLVAYSRACDACRAFAPRVRMLARLAADAWGPGAPRAARVRVAQMDVRDNDADREWLPSRATPSVRVVPAGGGGGAARRASIVAMDLAPAGAAAAAADGANGGGERRGGGTSGGRVTLPTLPQLLDFLEAATGGRAAAGPDIRARAVAAEAEAAALEDAYDATLRYAGLWRAYDGLVADAEADLAAAAAARGGDGGGGAGADAAGGAPAAPAGPPSAARAAEVAAARRASDELRAAVLRAHAFIADEADEGALGSALERLDAVAGIVRAAGVDIVVRDSLEPPPPRGAEAVDER